jgi:hypothetical protein
MFTKIVVGLIAGCAGVVWAADGQKDERGGKCDDAKKQFEYFCEKKGGGVRRQERGGL